MEIQNKATTVWNEYYKSREQGPVGNLYPNENLVRVVSTIRKGIAVDEETYYCDHGKENSNRVNFSGESLELGFGHVANLMMMRDKGYKAYGLEVSEDAVTRGKETLKKQYIDDIKIDLWTPTNIPYSDEKFDFVYGLQCIYYCINLDEAIDEIFRVLKPGGSFCFSFFGEKHDYLKYTNFIKEGNLYDIVEWSDDHPSTRIRRSPLAQVKNNETLYKLFDKSSESRIFTEDNDFAPIFNSWVYIYGKK